jgi:hypothetical protein
MSRIDAYYFAALSEPPPGFSQGLPKDFPNSPKDYLKWESKQLAEDFNAIEKEFALLARVGGLSRDDYLFWQIPYCAYKMRSDLILEALKANDRSSHLNDEWAIVIALHEAHSTAYAKLSKYFDTIYATYAEMDGHKEALVQSSQTRVFDRLMAYRIKLHRLAQKVESRLGKRKKTKTKKKKKKKETDSEEAK